MEEIGYGKFLLWMLFYWGVSIIVLSITIRVSVRAFLEAVYSFKKEKENGDESKTR